MNEDESLDRSWRLYTSPYILTLKDGHPAQDRMYDWLAKHVGRVSYDWVAVMGGGSDRYAFLTQEHLDQATAFAKRCED